MDIAFVSNVVYPFVPGGAQKRIHEIGTRLAASGHTVTVYGRHFWDGPAATTHEGLHLRAVGPSRNIYAGDRRSIVEAVTFGARLFRPLRRRIGAHDVVVVSVFPYFPVLTARACTVGRDVALVTTWHEVWGDYWDEYLGALGPIGKVTERTAASVSQDPIAVSTVTADRLAQIGPARERISVVPNGIDSERIQATSAVPDGDTILFAGRLVPDKNIDVLLRAFERIATGSDATLGIVGTGPSDEQLRGIAAELDSADRISFYGELQNHDEVIARMQAADVFAFPSTREGFGIAVLEAMGAGCTVVAASHPTSAVSDVVADTGVIREPTVEAFADGLDSALRGDVDRSEPEARARQFDWDLIADRAEQVYRTALQEA
mgnify:CR=1 FL=1